MYSYGTMGGFRVGNQWILNGIIGVSQVGSTLTIASFTDSSGDQRTPVDQITYTLQKD